MTTQARPDWNAEMQRQIRATESAQALVNDHEATIIEQRKAISKLRGALQEVRRIANRGDVFTDSLLALIADTAGVALEQAT